MITGADAVGAGRTRQGASMAGGLRAVCQSSSWLHRFAGGALVLTAIAGIAGVAGIAQAVAGSAGQMPPMALIGFALVAAAAAGAGRVSAVIERWLDVLGQAFDGAAEAQLVIGSGSRAVQANLAFERLFPGAGEFALDLIEQAAEPASSPAFRRLREQAAIGAHATAIVRLQPADGDPPRLFEISVEPGSERSGYRLWTFRDAGARHRQQPTPSPADAVFADLLDRASTGFYSLDSEGRFVAVNRTLAQWLGVGATELIDEGARLNDFLAASPVGEAFCRDRLGSSAQPGGASLRTRRGEVLDVSITRIDAGSGAERRVTAALHLVAPPPRPGFRRQTISRTASAVLCECAGRDRGGRSRGPDCRSKPRAWRVV